MSYITPVQLAELPGPLELAQVASTAHEVIVDAELMDLTLRGLPRTGYTAEQLAAADAALARINDVITDTDAFVDGYLALRFTLPLVLPAPKILTVWSRAIVRYHLAKDLRDDERSNPIVRGYRDALKLLGEVRDGKLSIGITDPASAASSSADVQFQTDSKTFGRTELGAFR